MSFPKFGDADFSINFADEEKNEASALDDTRDDDADSSPEELDRLRRLVLRTQENSASRQRRLQIDKTSLELELENTRLELEQTRLDLRKMSADRDRLENEWNKSMLRRAEMAKAFSQENGEMIRKLDAVTSERDALRSEVAHLKSCWAKVEHPVDIPKEDGSIATSVQSTEQSSACTNKDSIGEAPSGQTTEEKGDGRGKFQSLSNMLALSTPALRSRVKAIHPHHDVAHKF